MERSASLGAAIRARRLELGWTQEQLAERISDDDEYIRQSDISRLESGRVNLPRRARLERVASALNLSLGELLARSGWNNADSHFSPNGAQARRRSTPAQTNEEAPAVVTLSTTEPAPGDDRRPSQRESTPLPEGQSPLRRTLDQLREQRRRLERNLEQAESLRRQYPRLFDDRETGAAN